MSALPPSPEQGIQAPNAITLLWERYRSLAYVVVLALLAAMGLHYFLRYQQQKEVDGQQTEFVTSIGLEGAYENSEKIFDLQDSLGVGGGGPLTARPYRSWRPCCPKPRRRRSRTC
jgi:hypothetical protein